MDYFDLSIENTNRLRINPSLSLPDYGPLNDESNASSFPITKYIRFKKSGYKTIFIKVTLDWYTFRTDGAIVTS